MSERSYFVFLHHGFNAIMHILPLFLSFFCPLGVQWLSLVPAIERKTRNSEHNSKTPLEIVQVKY